jgi:hypothetical protein
MKTKWKCSDMNIKPEVTSHCNQQLVKEQNRNTVWTDIIHCFEE